MRRLTLLFVIIAAAAALIACGKSGDETGTTPTAAEVTPTPAADTATPSPTEVPATDTPTPTPEPEDPTPTPTMGPHAKIDTGIPIEYSTYRMKNCGMLNE